MVAIRTEGDAAYALFDTGPEERPYLYGVNYERRDGLWLEGASGNGPGWSQVGADEELGTLAVWGEAPGADRVRVEFGGESREEPVSSGAYLAVWWNVRCPPVLWLRASAFRVDGEWTSTA